MPTATHRSTHPPTHTHTPSAGSQVQLSLECLPCRGHHPSTSRSSRESKTAAWQGSCHWVRGAWCTTSTHDGHVGLPCCVWRCMWLQMCVKLILPEDHWTTKYQPVEPMRTLSWETSVTGERNSKTRWCRTKLCHFSAFEKKSSYFFQLTPIKTNFQNMFLIF